MVSTIFFIYLNTQGFIGRKTRKGMFLTPYIFNEQKLNDKCHLHEGGPMLAWQMEELNLMAGQMVIKVEIEQKKQGPHNKRPTSHGR